MNELDLYEYKIDDIDKDGMTAISLVDFPAMEKDFILLSKNKQKFAVSKIDNKNIITGPAIIPDKEIYRYDWVKGEYNAFFSKETVKQISEQFINENKDNVTIDHSYNANNINLVESWIVEDPKNDKSNVLGFKDLPKGTWMVSYRVNNETALNKIKSGELKGFSLEAFITSKLFKKVGVDELLTNIENIINDDQKTDEEKYLEIDVLIEEDKYSDLW